MPERKRKAELQAILVYVDEPQVVALRDGNTHIIGVAVPSEVEDQALFFCVSVTPKNWESYFDESADLRYLFTYPRNRRYYTFDMNVGVGGKFALTPFRGLVPKEYLPPHRFFASHHTTDYSIPSRATDEQRLIIDGEWDMAEFGKFYERYSEVYAFVASVKNWSQSTVAQDYKRKILEVFHDRPFKGGGSYLHFYDRLIDLLTRSERIGLDRIKYASPGEVDIIGDEGLLETTQEIVENFINNKPEISRVYSDLHRYLSSSKFLQLAAANYPKDDPTAKTISNYAEVLNYLLRAVDFKQVSQLCDGNALVTAKVVLSLYRRVEETAAYFAQGRMSYTDQKFEEAMVTAT